MIMFKHVQTWIFYLEKFVKEKSESPLKPGQLLEWRAWWSRCSTCDTSLLASVKFQCELLKKHAMPPCPTITRAQWQSCQFSCFSGICTCQSNISWSTWWQLAYTRPKLLLEEISSTSCRVPCESLQSWLSLSSTLTPPYREVWFALKLAIMTFILHPLH